jgi:hypothetical protein
VNVWTLLSFIEFASDANSLEHADQRSTGSYSEQPRFFLSHQPQPGTSGLQIDPNAFILPAIGKTGPWPRTYLRGPGINTHKDQFLFDTAMKGPLVGFTFKF